MYYQKDNNNHYQYVHRGGEVGSPKNTLSLAFTIHNGVYLLQKHGSAKGVESWAKKAVKDKSQPIVGDLYIVKGQFNLGSLNLLIENPTQVQSFLYDNHHVTAHPVERPVVIARSNVAEPGRVGLAF